MQEVALGYQLSLQQEQLWDWQQSHGATWIGCAITLSGPLDAAALRHAVTEVVRRHEILRTQFPLPVGLKRPLQQVADDLRLSWDECQLTATHGDVAETHLRGIWHAACERVSDAMLRCTLVALTDERHVLLLSLPALCGDAGTLQRLLGEIGQRYAGQPMDAEEPVQYADYAEWQHALLQGSASDAETGQAFWQEHGSGAPALRLPWELRAGEPAEVPLATLSIDLDADLRTQLQALAAERGTTAAMVALAAWEAVLWRLSGESAISLAYVTDGRNHDELSDALGVFRKVLPIQSALDGEQPFSTVIDRTTATVRTAEQWQDYLPLDAAPGPDTIGFVWEERPDAATFGTVRFSLRWQEARTEPCKLQLVCVDDSVALRAELRYAPALLRRADVERLGTYWVGLLRDALTQPNAPIGSLALLDNAEQQELLVGLNQTGANYPAKCVQQLVEEQAARTPDRPAVACQSEQLSYAELNARANQVAAWLRRQGVGPDVRIGLCLERSPDLLVGLLGILKAGGAYVPLDSKHPQARWLQQLAEAGAPVVVTQASLEAQLGEFGGCRLCLDRDAAALDQESRANPECVNTPDDLAYVIYTSGSTGTPKGVAISHRNVVNYSTGIGQLLGLDQADGPPLRFGHVSTIAADLGNTCIFPSLFSGGCIQLLSGDAATDSQVWVRETADAPLDVLKITPSHLTALLGTPEGPTILPRRSLLLGGEAVSWELVQRVRELGQCQVFNHYGPTETTVGVLVNRVSDHPDAMAEAATVPIGRPLPNTVTYVLDVRQQPVPMGVAGELYVGGAGLAREYLNQPEQTAERFVSLPLGPGGTVRVYRTGDLVRYLPDGSVEFLGRVDDQVKVRGYRVEPGEIAGLLMQHPQVQQAVVLAEKAGEVRLIAYVVAAELPASSGDRLREWAAERLPEYMVPASVVVLEALPLTANGKVDRDALAARAPGRIAAAGASAAPRTPVEETVAAIWADVLGIEDVGIHDNFFDLGGHSLLAIQVITRVRSKLGVQLPLHSLFETPTVAGVAAAIVESQQASVDDPEIAQLLTELEGLSDEEVERLLALEE